MDIEQDQRDRLRMEQRIGLGQTARQQGCQAGALEKALERERRREIVVDDQNQRNPCCGFSIAHGLRFSVMSFKAIILTRPKAAIILVLGVRFLDILISSCAFL